MGIASCLHIKKKSRPLHMIDGAHAAGFRLSMYKYRGMPKIIVTSRYSIFYHTGNLFKGAALSIARLLMLGV